MTYADVARAAGRPRAARAVGTILNKNRDFDRVPCHRVVRSDGMVGGYVHGSASKKQKLQQEGEEIEHTHIDIPRYRYANQTN